VTPTVKKIDAAAECTSFITAAAKGKPPGSTELPGDLQKQFLSWLDQVQVCKAFVAKSDQPCMALPAGGRQEGCKAKFTQLQAMTKDSPAKVGRALFATNLFNNCRFGPLKPEGVPDPEHPTNSEAECRALERAVREANPKLCSAMESPQMGRVCKSWALGDPKQCATEDGEKCSANGSMLAKINQEGPLAIPVQDPESKLLIQIGWGHSKVGCDGLIDVVKTDCIEKTRKVLAEAEKKGAPAAGAPPVGTPPAGAPVGATPPSGAPPAGAPPPGLPPMGPTPAK